MKRKKIILLVALLLSVVFVCYAANEWKIVDDDCGKCKITSTTRKCGECGEFMESVDGSSEVKGKYMYSDFKCKKCGHTIQAKIEYQ